MVDSDVEIRDREIAMLEGEVERLRAEVAMLRGDGCEADGTGPCGVCLKCAAKGMLEKNADDVRLFRGLVELRDAELRRVARVVKAAERYACLLARPEVQAEAKVAWHRQDDAEEKAVAHLLEAASKLKPARVKLDVRVKRKRTRP